MAIERACTGLRRGSEAALPVTYAGFENASRQTRVIAHNRRVSITVSTDLPIPSEYACQLARKPEVLNHVLWPWLRAVPLTPIPEPVQEGDEVVVRLYFLRRLPGWTHTIRAERLTPQEIVCGRARRTGQDVAPPPHVRADIP